MENTKPETIAGGSPVEKAPVDTQGEEKEVETSKEHAKEHYTITPAHTNTPAGETVEDEEDAAPVSAPEAAEAPKEAQLNVQHLHEDATATTAAEDDNAKAEHVADSIALLHATGGAHSQQEEKQPNEASLEPLLSGIVEPTSMPAVPADQSSSGTASSPTLIIEKVDNELRHGDNFGSAATVGQKDAHLLRSQDAVPDHVIMRSESRTPELAETAFEVSESAALLDRDRDPPTPPISDEEAGRIGYRRMSSTPIPEVAKTAAEVADVATTLDERPAVSSQDSISKKKITNNISCTLKLHPMPQKSERMTKKTFWTLVRVLQNLRKPQDLHTNVLVSMMLVFPHCQLIAHRRRSTRLSLSVRHTRNLQRLIGMILQLRCSPLIEQQSFTQLGGCQSACLRMFLI
jgi:hypothetical protein